MGTHPIFESDFDCLTAKFRMDDLDVHAGSSDEDMVQNVKTRATRKKGRGIDDIVKREEMDYETMGQDPSAPSRGGFSLSLAFTRRHPRMRFLTNFPNLARLKSELESGSSYRFPKGLRPDRVRNIQRGPERHGNARQECALWADHSRRLGLHSRCAAKGVRSTKVNSH